MRPSVLLLVGFSLVLVEWRPGTPRLMWNATASVPIGLYGLSPARSLQVGDLVVFHPPPDIARMLDARGWLPKGVPLAKPVAALPGQRICRQGLTVTIDGRAAAVSLAHDPQGRALPRWSGCRRLARDEVLTLAKTPASFDGRYVGPIQRGAIIAVAKPLWTPVSGSRP